MSSQKIRLKLALPSVFVLLIAFTGLLIIVTNYYLSVSSLKFFARQYLHEISVKTLEKTLGHLQPAHQVVRMNARLLSPEFSKASYLETFNEITINELNTFPQLALLYFGDENGMFYMNAKDPAGAIVTQIISRLDDSPASREIIPKIQKMPRITQQEKYEVATLLAPYIQTVWWYRNKAGQIISEEVDATYPYDPRLRPWYKKAEETGAANWTSAYMFSSSGKLYASGKPGITVSAPVNSADHVVGVVGVDIVLEEISNFLTQLEIGKSGRAFIINSAGSTIALTNHEDLVKVVDRREKLNHIEDITDKAAVASFLSLHKKLGSCPYNKIELTDEVIFSFEGPDDRYFGLYTPFPKEVGLDWLIGIVVPETDFVGKVKNNIYIGLGVSIGVLLFVIWLSVHFTREVTTPVNIITEQAKKIREFDLDTSMKMESLFTEIEHLYNSFNSMQNGLKSFQKYVPADLVRYLINTGQEAVLGGQGREVTIWFADVANFTSISESMSPRDLVVHLGETIGSMSCIIGDRKGTVDKYIGDAVMAFWNAPDEVPDHPLQSCLAALEWRQEMERLCTKARNSKLPEMRTRVGLNTGEVVVGNMGSSERLNYTVIGDAVNLASRLEGLAKLYGVDIIIGESTYNRAKHGIVARRLDRVAVKGKTEGVFIYELVGRVGEVDEETTKFISEYQVALEAYFARQWRISTNLFTALREIRPNDASLTIFIKRNQHYQNSPPPDDWDGTFKMTKK